MSEKQLSLTFTKYTIPPKLIQKGLDNSWGIILIRIAFLNQTLTQNDKHPSYHSKGFSVLIHEQVSSVKWSSSLVAVFLPQQVVGQNTSTHFSLPSTKSGCFLQTAELDHSLPLTLLWKQQPPAGNGSTRALIFQTTKQDSLQLICQHTYSWDIWGDKCGGQEFTAACFHC